MSNFKIPFIVSVLCGGLIIGCAPVANDKESNLPIVKAVNSEFNNYWYAGKAEITSYELKQSRYGEVHDGEAVLIFVTEPFSKL
ncbi:MAG: septum formation inhibitor Maf, partial [Bacteroidota bacterium]